MTPINTLKKIRCDILNDMAELTMNKLSKEPKFRPNNQDIPIFTYNEIKELLEKYLGD